MTLKEALQVLIDEHIDDMMVYQIRDSEGLGWDGPRVLDFITALKVIEQHLADSEGK
jgi:hypothetical protein